MGDLPEKEFIALVLAKFAVTARRSESEDCIIIELGGTDPEQSALVLNVDHPSYIRGKFRNAEDYVFYGRWVAAATCGDVISMGVRPSGFALDLSAPRDTAVADVELIYSGCLRCSMPMARRCTVATWTPTRWRSLESRGGGAVRPPDPAQRRTGGRPYHRDLRPGPGLGRVADEPPQPATRRPARSLTATRRGDGRGPPLDRHRSDRGA